MAEAMRRRLEGRDDAGFYASLGVPPTASEQELRRAYLGWAKQLHPDKNPNDVAAAQRLARIGEAWAVLKSRRLRAVYDAQGKAGLDELSDLEGGDDEDDESQRPRRESTDDYSDGDDDGPSGLEAFRRSPAGSANEAAATLPTGPPSEREPALPVPVQPFLQQAAQTAVNLEEETLRCVDAVAEAIRRTEERAAARYEKALALLAKELDPRLDDRRAKEKARHAWDSAPYGLD